MNRKNPEGPRGSQELKLEDKHIQKNTQLFQSASKQGIFLRKTKEEDIRVLSVTLSNTENDTKSTTTTEYSSLSGSKLSDAGDNEEPNAADAPPDNTKELLLASAQFSRFQRIIAGSGHILNDICAAIWFSYFVLFMNKVTMLSQVYAGMLMWWGQLVDGLATPTIGYLTDRITSLWPCKKDYGRCKSWHLLGVILVTCAAPFVYSPPIGYSVYTDDWSEVAEWKKTLYLGVFVALFQIGWASTQISHLALIPKITPDELIRTEILAIRYAFTVMSNISVYLIAWMYLSAFRTTDRVGECKIDKDDDLTFVYIVLTCVAIGLVFSLIFHVFVEEKSDKVVKKIASLLKVEDNETENSAQNNNPSTPAAAGGDTDDILPEQVISLELGSPSQGDQTNDQVLADGNNEGKPKKGLLKFLKPTKTISTKSLNIGKEVMKPLDWLKLPQFYLVAGLYACTRLTTNIIMAYVPFYVETSLGLGCESVAYIPLIVYCTGFVAAMVVKPFNKWFGRQLAYAIGAVLILASAALILFVVTPGGVGVYAVAVLFGGGSSFILITSLSVIADLIGSNTESGAFVYGAIGLFEKIACGGVLWLIGVLCDNCDDAEVYWRNALGWSTGACCAAALLITVLITMFIKSKPKSNSKNSQPAQVELE